MLSFKSIKSEAAWQTHKKQFQEQMETSFALHMMTGGNVSRPSPLYQKISARAGPVALQQKKKEREREKAWFLKFHLTLQIITCPDAQGEWKLKWPSPMVKTSWFLLKNA